MSLKSISSQAQPSGPLVQRRRSRRVIGGAGAIALIRLFTLSRILYPILNLFLRSIFITPTTYIDKNHYKAVLPLTYN